MVSFKLRGENERRRLSQEEKHVANTASEYRRRVAEGDGSGQHRSRTILNRVQNFIRESNKP
ncbi:Actin-regulating kinase PRK1 [Penicillium cataractarum]|uniref:Actin-regulating kinase PRK1 n=1 Tax=Penicillium cataractarum TaxID=2100454 RepID=A0A9W9S156_9EURO|nr:Actin-regulating kinase PRK1 [Penicillium cataractarum]KAJ5370128.1 Actin-regulating kinase PRK1 [Penicillium cataractarum]